MASRIRQNGKHLPEFRMHHRSDRGGMCAQSFLHGTTYFEVLVQPCLVEDTGPDSKMRFAVIHLSQPRSQLAVNAGPLKDRSCVLQERALFPRIVPKQPTVSFRSVVS